jgi:hypothetical protein
MKLLVKLHDEDELSRVLGLLRAKGIPGFVQGSGVRGSVVGHVFVVLDRQLGDAQHLLVDPDHEVSEPVDVEDFERSLASHDSTPILIGAAIVLVAVIAALVLMGWWLARERDKAEKADDSWARPVASTTVLRT